MAAKEKSGTRAKLVPFFFKYKLNPELLACIGVSTHITNGLLKCPFQDNSILVFRPEWLLIWITVAWPHLKVSNIAAGSNTRSTRHRALSLFTAEPPGRALMLKPQQLLWLPLTLHTAAIKSLSIIKTTPRNNTHPQVSWPRCTWAYTFTFGPFRVTLLCGEALQVFKDTQAAHRIKLLTLHLQGNLSDNWAAMQALVWACKQMEAHTFSKLPPSNILSIRLQWHCV